jgi:hypothetical protein
MTDDATEARVFAVHDHEGELDALAAAASSPDAGEALLEVARDAADLVSAIAASPAAEEPADDDEWGAIESEGQLTVVGPDFLMTAAVDSGELSIMSGTARWSIARVDEEGRPLQQDAVAGDVAGAVRQAGRRVLRSAAAKAGLGGISDLFDGPIRVTVADAESLLGDWTFGAAGAVDNADFDAATAELEDEVGEILATAVQDEAEAFEESQASASSGGGEAQAGPDASSSGSGGRRGGAVVGGVVAAAGTMAAREAVRRTTRRVKRLTAERTEPTPDAAPALPVLWWFSVDEAVSAQSSAGAMVAQLGPGTWYPAHHESGGWVETTAGGVTGWIPAWAARRAP